MVRQVGPARTPSELAPFGERVLTEGSSLLKATVIGALLAEETLSPAGYHLLDRLRACMVPGSLPVFSEHTSWSDVGKPSGLMGQLGAPVTREEFRILERTAAARVELYPHGRREAVLALAATMFGTDASTSFAEPYPIPEPAPAVGAKK